MDFSSLGLSGKKVLFVASVGGHLAELGRIVPVIDPAADSALVTFESPQSSDLSWVDDIRYVPNVRPRDARGTAKAAGYFVSLLRKERWDAVVSTGAAIAVAALPFASTFGIRSIYIESYARFSAPSTTGRILARISPGTELYSQHRKWTTRRWGYTGSVIDTVRLSQRRRARPAQKWFITLGTIAPYRFDALIESVLAAIPRDADVVWQLGCTDRTDLPGNVHSHLDSHSFMAEAAAADIVISHAGVGTALELIDMGHRPVIVPRRAHRAEHVDDHQLQIAEDLSARGLALSCEADDLNSLLVSEGISGVRGAYSSL